MNLPEKRLAPYLLNMEEIQTIKELISPEWMIDGTKSIQRKYKFSNFKKGLNFVVAIGAIAEEMNHHPDIDIRWRTVTFILTTHSAGTVTDLDVELASRIDNLLTSRTGVEA